MHHFDDMPTRIRVPDSRRNNFLLALTAVVTELVLAPETHDRRVRPCRMRTYHNTTTPTSATEVKVSLLRRDHRADLGPVRAAVQDHPHDVVTFCIH